MEFLYDVFPLILYFLAGVLLVVLIMLVIKLIDTVEKTNVLLDDIEQKSQSLNGLFSAIDSMSETISSVNIKMVGFVTKLIEKIFSKKKKKKKIEKENEDYE